MPRQGSAERQTVGLLGRGQLQAASGDLDRGGMGGGCVFRKGGGGGSRRWASGRGRGQIGGGGGVR